MATAGEMILAGDVARALWWYEHGGRGAAGWEYVERKLRELHPDSKTNSINAVIRITRETVAVGNRYRQGKGSYSPAPSTVPDARPLEWDSGNRGPPGGDQSRSFWRHEGVVEVVDEGRGGAVIQRYNVTINSQSILDRQTFEDELKRQGSDTFNRFLNYDRDRLTDDYNLQYRIRIEGVFRTF